MIYNRTQIDVDNAVEIRANKVQTFQPLTDADIEVLERGMLTINTLNRIESKQRELKALFDTNFYFVDKIENKEWDRDDLFYQSDFDRLKYNLEMLRKAYFVFAKTPDIPARDFFHFQRLNDFEKNLFDLEKMLSDIASQYRECGDFECGGT